MAVVDFVRHCGGVRNVTITPQMRNVVQSPRVKYRIFLEEEKQTATDTEKRLNETLFEEFDALKKKRQRFESDTDSLEANADKLSFQSRSHQHYALRRRI